MKNLILRDRQFTNLPLLVDKLKQENQNQLAKWGIQTHTVFEWLAFTMEELGELAKAVAEYEYKEGNEEEIIKEAIQVATLSLKIVEMTMQPYPSVT